MLVALTGTPGVGKTAVSQILRSEGFDIIDLNKLAVEHDFWIGTDKQRDSKIIDIEQVNKYVTEIYKQKDIVIIEGHLSHLLKSVDNIIVLRCHPSELKKRLSTKGWNTEKIRENIEAEILDVILCEAVERYAKTNMFEIDTTDKSIAEVASAVVEIIRNKFKNMKKYNIGKIDWSEEILKEF